MSIPPFYVPLPFIYEPTLGSCAPFPTIFEPTLPFMSIPPFYVPLPFIYEPTLGSCAPFPTIFEPAFPFMSISPFMRLFHSFMSLHSALVLHFQRFSSAFSFYLHFSSFEAYNLICIETYFHQTKRAPTRSPTNQSS
jgi:hypothetical protein